LAGASGIRVIGEVGEGTKGEVLKPDSNTNLLVQRSLIPTIQTPIIKPDNDVSGDVREVVIATAVFAVTSSKLSANEMRRRWFDYPKLVTGGTGRDVEGDHIQI
jgi:hypothetical protein